MACRSRPVVALLGALTVFGCQQLPEAEDDGTPQNPGGTSTGEGGTFISGVGSEEEGGDELAMNECNPVTQTGCGAGERCTATKSGATIEYACVANNGTADPFEPCVPNLSTGDDGCPAGFACLGTQAVAACVPLCITDSDCSAGVCTTDPFDFVPHCANDCSPFEPTCPSPLACRRLPDRFGCVFTREEDVGVTGDACVAMDDAGCTTGFVCIAGELVPSCTNDHCCTPLCDLGGGDSCPAPSTCAAALEAPAPGFESVGACFVPA